MRTENGMGTLCPMHSDPFLRALSPRTRALGVLLGPKSHSGLPGCTIAGDAQPGTEGGKEHECKARRAPRSSLGSPSLLTASHWTAGAPLRKAPVSSSPRPTFLTCFNLLNLGRLHLHPGHTRKTNPKLSEPSRISRAVSSPGFPEVSQPGFPRHPAVSTGT